MSGEVVIQTVMERRSCRKYDQRRVPHAVLERIVEAGRRAPTGMDRQELNFYVAETPEVAERIGSETAPAAMKAVPHLIDRVKQMGISNPITCGAPACVVVTVRNEPELLKYAQIDTGLAVENMLIAAQALGLRGLPVALAAAFNERGILDIVGAGTDEKMMLLVALGYPDAEYDKTYMPEKHIKSMVKYI